MAPNVINDALPDGGGLSMIVVGNNKMNEAQAALYVYAEAAAATPNAPAVSDTPNEPVASATVYVLAAADKSNAPAAETP